MTAFSPESFADVVLHPGVMQGITSFTGETINSIYVSANSNEGFSGSLTSNANTYALTLEGGHAYTPMIQAVFTDPVSTSYLHITRNTPVLVPVSATVQQDFVYGAARIHGTVNVIGGTVQSLELRSSANEEGESYSMYVYQGANPSFSFPMVLDTQVQVWGTAQIGLPNGSQMSVMLAPTTISLGATGADIGWSIDTSTINAGTLQGALDLSESGGPDIVSNHQIYLYGSSAQTAGLSRYETFGANGAYSIPNLVAGDYWSYGWTYFDAPYGYYQHPTTNVTIPPGGTVNRDFKGELGFLSSKAFLYGFRYTESVTAGQIGATNSSGGKGYDSISLPDGDVNLALPAGDYKNDYYYFYFNEPDPVAPLEASFYRYNAPSPPITVIPGFHGEMDPVSLMNVEAKIIFDVFEPSGATTEETITRPRIHGYTADGRYLEAYGSNTPSAKQILRLIGEPGTYTINAYATVGEGEASFGQFSMTLSTPEYIAPIFPGPVEPMPGLSLTFTAVTGEGYITATSSPIGPQPPSGLKLLTEPPTYYDIMTTGQFTPPVTVCMTYDDFAGENNIRMMHYDESVMDWVDVTTTVDTTLNKVCGSTPSFSIFALMAPTAIDDGSEEPDEDPCPDSLSGLCPFVQSLSLPEGTTQSLCAKAQAAAAASSSKTAANQIGAFVHAVEAQRGKKIPADAAELLITCATNLSPSSP